MIKNFDLNGWTCFSERRNSKSYYSPDKKWLAKFSSEKASSSDLAFEKEKGIVLEALKIGISTPKVKDVVELEDGTHGIIYEYIENKKSIARACGEDIEHLDMYMKRFAKAANEFHSRTCMTDKFYSFVDLIKKQVVNRGYFTEEQKEIIFDLIDKTEMTRNVALVDFHSGNFIIAGDKEYVIDIGTLSYGNPIYDLSIFYYFTHNLPVAFTPQIFHCEPKYNNLMWESFIKYYYDIKDEKALKEINDKMEKYSIIAFEALHEFVEPGPNIKDFIDANFGRIFGLK